jgi:hypothetical protein
MEIGEEKSGFDLGTLLDEELKIVVHLRSEEETS